MNRSVTLAALALVSGSARAGSTLEVYLRAEPPNIEATIIGGPRLPLEHIRLTDTHGASIPAHALRDFKGGPDTVAIAFVVAGSEIMMGNTDLVTDDDPSSFRGYLKELNHGLAGLDLAHAMPPGSVATVITYDDTARVRVPMGPVSNLGSSPLGSQRDYYGKLGSELVVATTLAIDELDRARTARKVLVVIGDGNDTNNEAAGPQLAALKKRACADGIQTYGIIYKSPLSAEGNVITKLIATATTVNSVDGIVLMLNSIVARLDDRYYVTFPGDALQWDGEQQELAIDLGLDRTDSVAMILGERRRPSSGLSWWAQLALGAGLVSLLVLLIRARVRVADR